jgi:hypothetical protein
MAVQKITSAARNRRRSDKNPGRAAPNGGAITDRVALRAYERFLARGGEHGRDVEDWLEAEREIASGLGRGAGVAALAIDDPARDEVRRKPYEAGAAQVSEID